MRTLTVVAAAILAAVCLSTPVGAAEPDATALLVRDISSSGGSDPRLLTRAAGLVFFTANDGVHGRELWSTDGSKAGTRLVRDIQPGASGSRPALLTRVGTRLYFVASDGIHGRELWVSDGTRSGTRMVKDLARGSSGSGISGIADGGGTAYFGLDYRSLWRTDGTAVGTRLIREFQGVSAETGRWMGGRLYFTADDALWKTDGSKAGTGRISPSYWGIDDVTVYRRHIYYRADPPLGPYGGVPELWWSDGTKAGTERLGTMLDPTSPIVFDDLLYFNARRSASKPQRLYRSDGTVDGTLPVSPWVRPLWQMTSAAGRLWAPAASPGQMGMDELWVSDGTAGGTARLYSGDERWYVYDWEGPGHAGLSGRLGFVATPTDTAAGNATDAELWRSDGTAAGTVEAADINPDGSSFPRSFARLGKTLLFSASDGTHGRELWSVTQD